MPMESHGRVWLRKLGDFEENTIKPRGGVNP